MPQCTSQKRTYLQPYGRGSLHSDLIDVTFKVHQRINKVNEGEGSRFKVVANLINRHQEIEQTRIARTIGRMKQDLEKFRAYQKVLDEYKVNKLQTLQLGFNKRAAMTPHTKKRYQSESRLYFAGFSMHALEPQVKEMIEKIKPRNKRGEEQQKLLEVSKRRSDYVIDRKVTNEAIKRERFMHLLAKGKQENERVSDDIQGLNKNPRIRKDISLKDSA